MNSTVIFLVILVAVPNLAGIHCPLAHFGAVHRALPAGAVLKLWR